jgi:short-subunit dehydrogenase
MAGCCASKYAILEYQNGVRITVVSPIGVKTNFFNNRSFENHKPNYTVFMLETTTVSKAILAAANSTRLEIMVPFYARAGCGLKILFHMWSILQWVNFSEESLEQLKREANYL